MRQTALTPEEQLDIVARAWGMQDGSGYVFFPWIDGQATTKEERIKGFREGPAFMWPDQRDMVLEHLAEHQNDDLYWCPSMFEAAQRRPEFAMDECALWADLDEVDPRDIDEQYRPTIAWQTSEDHYQALWLTRRPVLGVSWPGEENQKLTYYLGGDSNGWGTNKLLRLPGSRNHKPDRKHDNDGKPVQGKLLWDNGPRYSRMQFEDLPEVKSRTVEIRDLMDSDLAAVEIPAVMARIKLKLSKRVREFLKAREVQNKGARSEILWEIERELADAGCSLAEIVAIVERSVWNKYNGRSDERLRLVTEASRALDEAGEVELDFSKPSTTPRIADVLANIKPPQWLVRDIWTRGSCGFLAGQPKSWKSWIGLDMALSLSTGTDFLGTFPVVQPGPVLYVQEEDPAQRLKDRFDKMWVSKADWNVGIEDGVPVVIPASDISKDPDIGIHLKTGIVLSDEVWMEWLHDVIAEGLDGVPYQAVILDPLMYMLGDVDQDKAGAMMSKVFRPLKTLANEFDVAVMVVHHMRKASKESGSLRGGQLMLGSVANHAWTEDSLYISRRLNELVVEVESKTAPGGTFKIAGVKNRSWTPVVYDIDLGGTDPDTDDVIVRQSQDPKPPKAGRPSTVNVIQALQALGPATPQQIADHQNCSRQTVYKALTRAATKVTKQGNLWHLNIAQNGHL